MARQASIGTMIAAAALIAWPVLAQTTSPGSSPGGPGTTAPAPASPGMTGRTTTGPSGSGSSTTASAPRYHTTDGQLRMSKVVGATVYNDQNQSVGTVDDLLVSGNDHKAATAVISVGGFLGMGAKLVSVPFEQLKVENDRIVMPGATKASLEGMPEFRYTSA